MPKKTHRTSMKEFFKLKVFKKDEIKIVESIPHTQEEEKIESEP